MYDKVIVIDYGVVVHTSIFSLKFNPKIPVTFTALNIMIGLLYKLDITPDTLIIVAKDARNSWRKDYETAYKGNRQEKREASGIDFPLCYSQLNKLADELNTGLNWHFIESPRCEADDTMAVACRFFKDYSVVLVTIDKDLEQCWEYPNVRIFSNKSKKWKIKPNNFDYNRFISEKIYREAADNMVTPVLDESGYEARHKCVNLLTLPEHIESAITEELNKISPKKDDINSIPFKSLQQRYANIYNDKSKVVDYNKQIEKENKKELREKTKKEKLKKAKQKEKQNGKITKNSEPAGCITA